jgi:hypothetical protein
MANESQLIGKTREKRALLLFDALRKRKRLAQLTAEKRSHQPGVIDLGEARFARADTPRHREESAREKRKHHREDRRADQHFDEREARVALSHGSPSGKNGFTV